MLPAAFDLLLTNAHLATLSDTGERYGAIHNGALGIREGQIAWVGTALSRPRDIPARETLDCHGAWVTPGLIDCHTHAVYAGNRSNEFEQRLDGATYAEIARAGGGINATVRATRAASEDELAHQSRPRLAALAAEGVTTIEIKSGYGLETETELRQLVVARRLGEDVGVDVRTSLLAAHALPAEYEGRADAYIDYVCRDTIPAAAALRVADAVDAFCETIGFTAAQTQRVFDTARAHGLPVKLHADQLSDSGGAALAARAGALSADHVEHANEEGVAAMSRAGTIAVLLPGAFFELRDTHLPPIAAFRAQQVPMAISTDCNPGTSPTTSLLLMFNMACTLFRLTPEETLAGATVHAARALGLTDRGMLAPGQRADLALWNIAEPAELSYRIGGNPNVGVIRGGRVIRWRQ